MHVLVPGFFGKLPAHGDFLRAAPPGAPLDLIDAWLAPARLGADPRADAILDGAGPVLALVAARGGWWALALFPSRDSVGRRFPFCILAGLPGDAFDGEPALVPVAFAPFLGRCLQHAAGGWATDPARLREEVAALGGRIDLNATGARLAEQLADADQRGLWTAMLGRGDDPRRLALYADVVATAQAGERLCGVRLRPVAQLHHLAFWLMLLRLSAPRDAAPSLIAIRPGGAGTEPSATVVWGRPRPEECLAALWPELPGGDAARIADPAAAPGRSVVDDGAPEFVDDLDLSLRDVLHSIGSQTRRFQAHGKRNQANPR